MGFFSGRLLVAMIGLEKKTILNIINKNE